jgi:hypothetical protein
MTNRRFDRLDLEHTLRLGRLGPGGRIRVMLDARELMAGLIRGRLRRRYPDLSLPEINLKVLEEIARAERTHPGP